jgi:hypothetical protein
MRGGVAEAGGNVAQGHARPGRRDVVRDAERSVAAGDDRGVVPVDPIGQPRGQLVAVPRGGDVEVRVERGTSQVDGAPNPIGACAAGPLVQEDGGARGGYGRASRISVAYSTEPVRK